MSSVLGGGSSLRSMAIVAALSACAMAATTPSAQAGFERVESSNRRRDPYDGPVCTAESKWDGVYRSGNNKKLGYDRWYKQKLKKIAAKSRKRNRSKK